MPCAARCGDRKSLRAADRPVLARRPPTAIGVRLSVDRPPTVLTAARRPLLKEPFPRADRPLEPSPIRQPRRCVAGSPMARPGVCETGRAVRFLPSLLGSRLRDCGRPKRRLAASASRLPGDDLARTGIGCAPPPWSRAWLRRCRPTRPVRCDGRRASPRPPPPLVRPRRPNAALAPVPIRSACARPIRSARPLVGRAA